jgi:pterin-4a-carbinolamine dehydratase/GNAT superfamily N-acetyltransferase
MNPEELVSPPGQPVDDAALAQLKRALDDLGEIVGEGAEAFWKRRKSRTAGGVGSGITGHRTFYHGTTKENAEKILKEGIKPPSHGTVFLTTDVKDAAGYSNSWGNNDGVILKVTIPKEHLDKAGKGPMHDIDHTVMYQGHVKPEWVSIHGSKPRGASASPEDLISPPGQPVDDSTLTQLKQLLDAEELRTAGGPGSGNFGHSGRPGEVGGSGGGTSELGKELSAKTWLHGTGHAQDGPLRDPVFLTTDPEGAAWYAQNRGDGHERIVPTTVDVKNPFPLNSYDDAVKLAGILKNAGIESTITMDDHGWTWQMSPGEHSPYDGDNPLDVVYHPEARRALLDAGFDAVYTKHDMLSNDSIDALIPLNAADQIKGKFSKRSLAGRVAGFITDLIHRDMLSVIALGGSVDAVLDAVGNADLRTIAAHAEMLRTLGDDPGHEFHGNQWTGSSTTDVSKILKFPPSDQRVGANVRKIDWTDHMYDVSPTEQKMTINTVLDTNLNTDNALFEAERTGKALVAGANEKFDMNVDVGAFSIRYTYEGDRGTQAEYTLRRDDDTHELTIHHEYLKVASELQGTGVAKDILRSNFAEYERLGVDRVELNADIDSGKYAWARFGFVPATGGAAASLYTQLATRVKQAKGDVGLELELSTEAKSEHPNPELVWKVADSPNGFDLLAGHRSKDWNAVFDLKNARQTDRLAKYLSAKPKQRAAGEGAGHGFHGNQWSGEFKPVPDVLYRGTGPGSFDQTARDFTGGELGGGVYFTADKSVADGYSEGPGHVTHAVEWVRKPTQKETGYLTGGPSDFSNEERLHDGLGRELWTGTTNENFRQHRSDLKDAALKAGLKVIIGMHNVSGAGQIAVLDKSLLRVVAPKVLGLHPELFKTGVLFYIDENGEKQDRALWEELLGEMFEPRTLGDKSGHEFHGNQWTIDTDGFGDLSSKELSQTTINALKERLVTGVVVYRGVKPAGSAPADPGDFGRGTYFSSKAYRAQTYGRLTSEKLTLQNPLVLSAHEAYDKLTNLHDTIHGKNRETNAKLVTQKLQARGYDGLAIVNVRGGEIEYVRFPTLEPKTLTTQDRVSLLCLRLSSGWSQSDKGISKTFSFPNRRASAAFTASLLEYSNNVNHHPDVEVDGDDVHVTYITHATNTLTDADFSCAEQADRLAEATPTLDRAAGEQAGHEFHGNQYDNKASWYRSGGDWNSSPDDGSDPYGWQQLSGNQYIVPAITHKVVRENGAWGYSHGNSQAITGAAAAQMSIPGYRTDDNGRVNQVATRFLTEIANDSSGSEEVLHHSFENIRGTNFQVGDTLRLPLTASSGDVGDYGKRLDKEDQSGQPVVFEFEKGTQMVAYGGMKLADARDGGHKTIHDAIKDRGHVWDEAIVAGGFKVTGVETKYMGSQHDRQSKGVTQQIYGKVVRLKQTETYHPKNGWTTRG